MNGDREERTIRQELVVGITDKEKIMEISFHNAYFG